jgi:hypothetical protein
MPSQTCTARGRPIGETLLDTRPEGPSARDSRNGPRSRGRRQDDEAHQAEFLSDLRLKIVRLLGPAVECPFASTKVPSPWPNQGVPKGATCRSLWQPDIRPCAVAAFFVFAADDRQIAIGETADATAQPRERYHHPLVQQQLPAALRPDQKHLDCHAHDARPPVARPVRPRPSGPGRDLGVP